MTKIKLCGLKRDIDIEVVNELKPDYIGFILAKKGHRQVSHEEAKRLKSMLDKSIKATGVFVDEEIDVISSLVNECVMDCIQLHGKESNEYINELKTKTDAYIIKAYRIDSKADIDIANNSLADMILLDSGTGGTGECFDWELLKGINRPFFLAGGINLDNVSNAVLTVNPYGIDVSSGIETDKVKDPNKMREMVKLIRNCN